MLTIVAVILALTVLPSPWGVVAVVGAAAIDVVEIGFFARWSKRRRATVGAETLVGRTAVVVRALSPRGQVQLDGRRVDDSSVVQMNRLCLADVHDVDHGSSMNSNVDVRWRGVDCSLEHPVQVSALQ